VNVGQLKALLQQRFDVATAERKEVARQVGQASANVSADLVSSRAVDLFQLDAVLLELQILLRLAHGMNANGSWPHPVDRCIMCGQDVRDNTDQLCHGVGCRTRHSEAYGEIS